MEPDRPAAHGTVVARIIHEPTAADAYLPESTALGSAKVLDVPQRVRLRAFALARLVSSGISAPSLRAFMNNAG
jgi:hypothetical protein